MKSIWSSIADFSDKELVEMMNRVVDDMENGDYKSTRTFNRCWREIAKRGYKHSYNDLVNEFLAKRG